MNTLLMCILNWHAHPRTQPDAEKTESILKRLHNELKSVKGFEKANRFVCKEHWDIKYFARLNGVPSLEEFLKGDIKKEKVDALVKEIETIAKDKTVHTQNFVADDWLIA